MDQELAVRENYILSVTEIISRSNYENEEFVFSDRSIILRNITEKELTEKLASLIKSGTSIREVDSFEYKKTLNFEVNVKLQDKEKCPF